MSLCYIIDIYDDTIASNKTNCEILIFGICNTKRVCIRVMDVPFYVFLQVPDDFEDCEELKNDINNGLKINKFFCSRTNCDCSVKQPYKQDGKLIEFMCTNPCLQKIKNDSNLQYIVSNVELMWAKSCVGNFPERKKFVKIRLTRPFFSKQICKFLYDYIKKKKWNGGEEVCEVFTDATTAFCYSYEKQKEICTGSVIDLSNLTKIAVQKTTCDEEYLVSYRNLKIENVQLPPPSCLVTIAFDIETSVKTKQSISTPDKDEILLITISFDETDIGFTWGNFVCDDLPQIQIYNNEKEMLSAFLLFIKTKNPDVITGYVCNSFDWNFIFRRAQLLGVPLMTELSRIPNYNLIYLNVERQSVQKGKYNITYIHCPGRLFIDMHSYVKELPDNLTGYKLNDVALHYLNEKKEDFDVMQNNTIFYGNDNEKRKEFFRYGLKDSRLALKLYNKTRALNSTLIQSKIMGMTARQFLIVGIQEQLRNLARRFFWPRGFLIPKHNVIYNKNTKTTEIPYYNDLPILCEYEGGLVIEPTPGRYMDPVITLDINSSYPSNMRSANLCISTVCKPDTPGAIKYSTGYWFVSAEKQKGLFPEMLELLMQERADAKILMNNAKKEGNKHMAEIYDITQNSLKLASNSLYGSSGTTDSIFYCPYVAATTTARGRECLQMLVDFSKKEGLEVIYGDTDSVFILLRGRTLQQAFEDGPALAKKINDQKILPPLVKIAFENVKMPFLITRKKKYMSINYTADKPNGELKQRGTIAVMSDNAPIASRIFTKLTELLLNPNTTLLELELFVRLELYKILNFNSEIKKEDFIIAQTLKKNVEDYKNEDDLVHLQALKHWKKWQPSTAPKTGDKIPYLIIHLPYEKAKLGECVRPPFMVESIREIDVERFIKNKLQNPISKLLKVAGIQTCVIDDIFAFPFIYSITKEILVIDPNKNVNESYLNPYVEQISKQPKITSFFKHI